MSFFESINKNMKIAAHMRNEQKRIDNLDWQGLEQHLKKYHEYFLYEKLIPTALLIIREIDPEIFPKLRKVFEDIEFGMNLEKCNYGILYLGWSKGVGLIDESIPDEQEEFNNSLRSIKEKSKNMLIKKGLDSDLVIGTFSRALEEMFEIGEQYGAKPEFWEFRPQKTVHIPKR